MATNAHSPAASRLHSKASRGKSLQIVQYKGGWYYTQSAGNNFWWLYWSDLLPGGKAKPRSDSFVHGTHLVWTGVQLDTSRKEKYTEAELGAH